MLIKRVFSTTRLELDSTLPVPLNVTLEAGGPNLGELPITLRWQGEGHFQAALYDVLKGKWQYVIVDEKSYKVSLQPGKYRFKVRQAFHGKPLKAGPWSEIITYEIDKEFRLHLKARTSSRSYKIDTAIPVPETIMIDTPPTQHQEGHSLHIRIRWYDAIGRHQIALYEESDESWSYRETQEDFHDFELSPGNHKVKVRRVTEENPPKAGPWSHYSVFTIDEDLSLTTKKTLADRIRESWRVNIQKSEPPSSLFIGGAARTGTTLLQSVLCSDPSTNPLISEAVPIRYLLDAYKKTINNYNAFPKMYFDDLEEISIIYSSSIEMLLNELKKKYDCKILVLKEPALTKYFPDMSNIINNVRFFCMVRDPRTTIASMIMWGEKMRQRNKKHFFQDKDMKRLSKYYLGFYVPLFNCNDVNFIQNTKYIRYEDLVVDTGDTLDVIRNFTRLELHDYDPGENWIRTKLDFEDRNSPMHDAVTELYGKPISASRIDSFREILTEEEIATIERECYPVFKYFNYHSVIT